MSIALLSSFTIFVVLSGANGALSTDPVVPASVNVCDSNSFAVYVNNTGTTPESDILINVTIPVGFSYDNGSTTVIFPDGDSNEDPTESGDGSNLEWDLTDITTAGTGVVINEIFPNPPGSESGSERVELYNAGADAINVSGWRLRDAGNNLRQINQNVVVAGSLDMSPGSFLVIRITGTILDNGGDTVKLFDGSEVQIDTVSYPDSASHENQSWASVPDGSDRWGWWRFTLGTTNGDLLPGDQIKVEFNLTSGCGTPSGGRIEVEAEYLGGSASRSSTSMMVTDGILIVTKTPIIVEADFGDAVNWTTAVENIGAGPAYNVRMTEDLSPGLDLLSIDSPSNAMTWTYDVISPGEVKTVNISARVAACEPLFSEVNASWGCDGNPCQETRAMARVDVVSARIEVDKTVDIPAGEVGTNVNFTIVVNNTGNATLNPVIVTDTLPLGLNYVSSVPVGALSGNVVVWNLGTMNPGDMKTIELVAHINGSAFGELQNVVVVEGKPEHGDNVTAEDSENVTALRADITVNKTVDKPIAKFGDIVNFTIVVTNAGNATLDPVIVTDTLPFCFEYNSSVPAGVHSGGVVTWNLGRLNATDWRVIYLEADVKCQQAGIFINLVEVEGKPEQGDNVTANDTAEVAIVRNLTITKVADKYEVKRGEVVTYTITVCNHGGLDETNVTVWDVFNRRVDILSMTPAPDPDGKWRFPVIPAKKDEADTDNCRSIIIKIKVPERQDFEFGMEQGVSGEGFVNVANDFSTTFQAYLLKNCAYATSDWNEKPISACVTVTVGKELGTQLSTRQYGSGGFDVEERVAIYTANKSIEWEEDLSAAYRPTTLTLYHNRTVAYDSAWVKKARAKNYITGTTMTETYHDAVRLDRESRMFLDENQSLMEVDSSFDGRGHIGFLKMPSGASSPRATPIFEAREDYVGSFKVLERVDEYGSSVSSEKAASGKGLVVIDKRVGSSQRTYESGTGSYDSEELIKTHSNYIAKDISLVHSPISQRLTDSTSINASMKWKEGIYSRNPGTSFIGEEYTGLTQLEKETTARGLNEMETEAYFSGRGMYRTVLKDEVDFDEVYEGDYSIERRVLFTGVSKYNRPHLNVTKTLEDVYQETLPWDYGEPHLEGAVKKRWVAVYTITIENDGDRSLDPVLVKDLFPPGAIFIEPSSVRPDVLTDTSANWTIPALTVGGVSQITLLLDVTKYYPDELVNRVEVCGGYDGGDDWICAANYSALEVRWLTCCLDEAPYEAVSVVKTGEIDPANPRVVRYRIDVSNHDGATRVATVTDSIPAGMDLLETSIPFASYEGGVVVWQILDIGPFETKTIEFSVLAPSEGRFTNSVEVDARSVDGPVVQPVYATCVIDVGVVEDECGPAGCGPWKPPNWQFEHAGYDPDRSTCELLTCTGCDGTESCLAP